MVKIKMECEVKKWGNSVGVILPKHVVEELSLKPKDKVNINVERGIKGKEIYGLFPGWSRDTQKAVDELKKGWE